MTKANPKIANYPFTTLSPQLGICEVEAGKRFVIADIPGLIEGASAGAGLGLDFLRHVERTRVIVHLLDIEPQDESDPVKNYKTIRKELKKYSKELDRKQELVVLNKSDLIPDEKELKKKAKAICDKLDLDVKKDCLVISGATRKGLEELSARVWKMLHPKAFKVQGWKKTEAVEA
jgi:GTP-binding protein